MDFTIGRSSIAGNGVFATQTYQKGDHVFTLDGEVVTGEESERLIMEKKIAWDDPLQVAENSYLILNPLSMAVNHSCDPSVGVRGVSELFALRNLQLGDEITYDYATVVGKEHVLWHMHCTCGAENCRGLISNWKKLPKERFGFYKKHNAFTDFVLSEITAQVPPKTVV